MAKLRALALGGALVVGIATLAPAAPADAAAKKPTAAIDTMDRGAVLRAYQDRLLPALATPSGWTGAASGCIAGSPSSAGQQATAGAINYYRAMVGLEPIALDPELDGLAQQAALLMQAQGSLDHHPPATWPCWTQTGYDAAGRSNLALGASGARAISLYLADPGANNTAAGHRRWILTPATTRMGSGSTSIANSLIVFGSGTDPDPARTTAAPEWLPWPSAGYFPYQLEPAGRWSLSSTRGVDFHNAWVSVTAEGHALPTTVNPVADGYGPNTLVWQIDSLPSGEADVDVTVGGMRLGGKDIPAYHYLVRLTDGMAAPPPTADPPRTRAVTTTTASVRSAVKKGRHPKVRITVVADRVVTGGQVRIKEKGRRLATTDVARGLGQVRLPLLRRGRHHLVVKYVGTAAFGPSRDRVTVVVRRA